MGKRDIFNSLHILNVEVLPLDFSAGLNESICSERERHPGRAKNPSPLSAPPLLIRKRDNAKHRNSHLVHLVTFLCFLHLVAAATSGEEAKLGGVASFQPLEQQKSRVPKSCLFA